MNDYLKKIEKYLALIPQDERMDIIKELQSHIMELQVSLGKTDDEIIEGLGDARTLAKSYIAEYINDDTKGRKGNKIFIAFVYGLIGLSGTILVPTLALCAAVFYLAVPVIFLAGLVKTGAYFIGIDVPFILMGSDTWQVPAPFVFPLTIPIAILFYFAGKACWKGLKKYFSEVGKIQEKIKY